MMDNSDTLNLNHGVGENRTIRDNKFTNLLTLNKVLNIP